MPLIDLKNTPSASMQRWFGASLACLLLIVAFALRGYGAGLSYLLAGAAAAIAVVYYSVAQSRIWIIRGWQYATLPIAWTVSHILLGLVYFGIFLPIGLIMRVVGYDPLRLRSREAESDWIERETTKPASSYFKQF